MTTAQMTERLILARTEVNARQLARSLAAQGKATYARQQRWLADICEEATLLLQSQAYDSAARALMDMTKIAQEILQGNVCGRAKAPYWRFRAEQALALAMEVSK